MSNFKYEDWLVHTYETIKSRETLCHFNPNHDPDSGQFAKGSGSSSSSGGFFAKLKAKKAAKKAAKEAEKKKAKEFDDDYWKIGDEFDELGEGKKLLEAVHKADKEHEEYYKSRENWKTDSKGAELAKRLEDADRDYCIAAGRNLAAQLIKKYGLEYTGKMLKIPDYSNEADLIKKAGEDYYDVHGM